MSLTRAAAYEDIPAISNVLADSWKTAYRGIISDDYLDSLSNDYWIDFLTVGLKSGYLFAMVLEDENMIIGAAILSKDGAKNEAYLISFYLLPEKIGQGFGHTFYAAIETNLKIKGFSKCVLDVLEDNKRAIRFYEKHGFAATSGRIKAIVGTHDYFCKVYEKNLNCETPKPTS